MLTFIFPDILESKGQACIFPLDDPHLPEGTLSHHSQEAEMVEVDCLAEPSQQSRL